MTDPRLAALTRAFHDRAWLVRAGKPIPYGEQLIIGDGTHEATLDFYPKRGRCVVGGSPSPLRQALSALVESLGHGADAPKAVKPSEPVATQMAELGMDESGKGDWFGPLVVAAVYVESAAAPALRKAGVRDSKLLDAADLPRVAAAIEQILPATAREVLVLDPATYNRRYVPLANINLLLAELYAEAALPLVARTGATRIICDQFAQRAERLESAFKRAGLPHPHQLHHAEASSLAVAAASVLATTRFQAELVRLGATAGLGKPLPSGASAIGPLRRAAQQIIAREGAEGLGRYAKLNFKPVRELLGP